MSVTSAIITQLIILWLRTRYEDYSFAIHRAVVWILILTFPALHFHHGDTKHVIQKLCKHLHIKT